MRQGLDQQGMYREQENSHLEWPDHTGVDIITDLQRMTSLYVKKKFEMCKVGKILLLEIYPR